MLGQVLLTGTAIGFLYGLITMGFVLIYKASGVFNIAQAQLVAIGAWILWSLMKWLGLPLAPGIVLTLVLSGLVGYVVQRLFLKPLAGQQVFVLFVATLALAALLDGFTTSIWGGPAKVYSFTLPGPTFLTLGPLQIATDYVWIMVICGVTLAAFFAFFKYAKVGLAMRASSEDGKLALSCGISLSLMFTLAWIMSAVLASIAGMFLGYKIGLQAGITSVGGKALAAAMLGGMESLGGAVIAGLIIGLVEVLAGTYLSPFAKGVQDVAPYIIMIIILFVKPTGLFGYKTIERV